MSDGQKLNQQVRFDKSTNPINDVKLHMVLSRWMVGHQPISHPVSVMIGIDPSLCMTVKIT